MSYKYFDRDHAARNEREAYDAGLYAGRTQECETACRILDFFVWKYGIGSVRECIKDALNGWDPSIEFQQRQEVEQEFMEKKIEEEERKRKVYQMLKEEKEKHF